MKKSVSLGLACLFALSAAWAGSDEISKPGVPPRCAAICAYFQNEATQFRDGGVRPGEKDARELCFDTCKPDQVPASQFWGSLDTPESRAIQQELLDYAHDYTVVTEVDMQGGAGRQFRLARIVGTAQCARDTYLERTPAGFRRISSPVLALFSEEAGDSCGGGAIYFSHYQGAPYAINTYRDRLEAYRIDPGFKLIKACSVPADDRFSYSETGLRPLPRRLENAIRRSGLLVASRCNLVGKKIHLRTGANFYLASKRDGCETHSSDFGEPIGKIWILTDTPKPKIIFSSEAISIFVLAESRNGFSGIETRVGHREVSNWSFDGRRYVEKQ